MKKGTKREQRNCISGQHCCLNLEAPPGIVLGALNETQFVTFCRISMKRNGRCWSSLSDSAERWVPPRRRPSLGLLVLLLVVALGGLRSVVRRGGRDAPQRDGGVRLGDLVEDEDGFARGAVQRD